jgi:hypothetical protein
MRITRLFLPGRRVASGAFSLYMTQSLPSEKKRFSLKELASVTASVNGRKSLRLISPMENADNPTVSSRKTAEQRCFLLYKSNLLPSRRNNSPQKLAPVTAFFDERKLSRLISPMENADNPIVSPRKTGGQRCFLLIYDPIFAFEEERFSLRKPESVAAFF